MSRLTDEIGHSAFSGRSEVYEQGRQGYPFELLFHLREQYGLQCGMHAADIGSGTGKFSEVLLSLGLEVFGVEPSEDMRRVAEVKLESNEHFHSISGSSSATGLHDSSIDLVTAAQAFHWFEPNAFHEECRRILKPNGMVFLIWNLRDEETGFQRQCADIYRKYCPNFHGFSGNLFHDDESVRTFFRNQYDKHSFDGSVRMTRERFLKRSLSSSFSLKEGESGYELFLSELSALFAEYEQEGTVNYPVKTVLYAGKL